MIEFDKNFAVLGDENVYNVHFVSDKFGLKAHCNCTAGLYNSLCRHITACIDDKEISESLEEYGLLQIYREYLQKKNESEKSSTESKPLKKKLERLLLDAKLLSADKFWGEHNLEMHNTPEQLERQENLSSLSILGLNEDLKSGIAKEKKSIDEGESIKYPVNLYACTCDDFLQRQLPCKHMYKLASEIGVYNYEYSRSPELIADFSKGYADNWKFIVRPCNYDALDIKYSTRTIEGHKEEILTQGAAYNFLKGNVFYDDLSAYDLSWSDALKVLKNAVQIDFATPSEKTGKIIYEDRVLKYVATAFYGIVEFSHYQPNQGKSQLEKVAEYSCRQDEFLHLLKTGEFADLNGEVHKI